jgi:hypothetical protein
MATRPRSIAFIWLWPLCVPDESLLLERHRTSFPFTSVRKKWPWMFCGICVSVSFCHLLSGVVVSVLSTGPTSRGFKSGRGDEFLRAIKILSTPSSRMGSKAGRSHVVRFYGMFKIPSGISDTGTQNSHSFVHSSYFPRMSLLVGLPASCGRRVTSYPQPASSLPWLFMVTYYPGGWTIGPLVRAVLRHSLTPS